MSIKTSPFDAAEHLGSDEAIAVFVDEALGSADAAHILDALAVTIRAKGMNEIAGQARLTPASLRQDLKADPDLKLATVIRLLRILGLRLAVRPIAREKPKRRARKKTAGKARRNAR